MVRVATEGAHCLIGVRQHLKREDPGSRPARQAPRRDRGRNIPAPGFGLRTYAVQSPDASMAIHDVIVVRILETIQFHERLCTTYGQGHFLGT